MVAAFLASPEQQFADGNGAPYAGGTLLTYTPGTTSGKATWADRAGAVVNPNPIILDAAGRATIFGDGAYRMILHDGAGNLIWDQENATLVSAAMAPVVAAADLATARAAFGLDALISAGIAAESAARIAGDTQILAALQTEITRATGNETTINNAVSALASTTNASIGSLTGRIAAVERSGRVIGGVAAVSSSGHLRVTFGTPFTTISAVTANDVGTGFQSITLVVNFDATGFDIWSSYGLVPFNAVACTFAWMAVGT